MNLCFCTAPTHSGIFCIPGIMDQTSRNSVNLRGSYPESYLGSVTIISFCRVEEICRNLHILYTNLMFCMNPNIVITHIGSTKK